MSMIKRVADAIRKREDEWLRQEGDARDGLDAENEDTLYQAMAKAALEAMRDPTEDMDKAARDECHKMAGVIDPVIHIWDRMIDSALNAGPNP